MTGLLLSTRHDWRTPGWFLDLVRGVGPIALDPATSPDNPTRALEFFAPGGYGAALEPERWRGSCGLAGSWKRDGLVFVNCPYGGHLSGPVEPDYELRRLNKATGERELVGVGRGWARRIASDDGEWIALVPSRTASNWWREMRQASSCAVLWGRRIPFVHPETGKAQSGTNFDSTVFYHGPNVARFVEVMGGYGEVILGGDVLHALAGVGVGFGGMGATTPRRPQGLA